jgi:hypothetical protein
MSDTESDSDWNCDPDNDICHKKDGEKRCKWCEIYWRYEEELCHGLKEIIEECQHPELNEIDISNLPEVDIDEISDEPKDTSKKEANNLKPE